MYNCQICGVTSQPRTPLLRHVVHRTINDKHPWTGKPIVRTEIACEVPVCRECQSDLRNGWSLHGLIADHRNHQELEDQLLGSSPFADVKLPLLGVPANVLSGDGEGSTLSGSPIPLQQLKEKLGQKIRIRNGKSS